MKFEKFDKEWFDLKDEELEFLKKDDEEFHQDMVNLMRFGIPAYDKNGHFADLRFKVRPMQVDLISSIREKCPEGWFKNQASLCRSIMAVGCKVYLKVLGLQGSEFDRILMGLNSIAKKQRLEEFKRDVESLRADITKGSMPPEEKLRIIEAINTFEEKMLLS